MRACNTSRCCAAASGGCPLVAIRWLSRPGIDIDPLIDPECPHCSSYAQAPFPIGRFYFLNAKPAWQSSQALQRLEQNHIMMDVIEADTGIGERGERPGAFPGLLQIVAGDFDDAPTKNGVRFLTEDPILLRDAWVEAGDGSPGYTFAQPAVGTPERFNEYSLPYTGPGPYAFGDRRIDYVFVRDGANRSAVWDSSKVVFDGKGAEWVSGHYGVFADLRPVPELSSALLSVGALAGLLGVRRRKSRSNGRTDKSSRRLAP